MSFTKMNDGGVKVVMGIKSDFAWGEFFHLCVDQIMQKDMEIWFSSSKDSTESKKERNETSTLIQGSFLQTEVKKHCDASVLHFQ